MGTAAMVTTSCPCSSWAVSVVLVVLVASLALLALLALATTTSGLSSSSAHTATTTVVAATTAVVVGELIASSIGDSRVIIGLVSCYPHNFRGSTGTLVLETQTSDATIGWIANRASISVAIIVHIDMVRVAYELLVLGVAVRVLVVVEVLVIWEEGGVGGFASTIFV